MERDAEAEPADTSTGGRWDPAGLVLTVLPALAAFAGGLAQLYWVLLAGPVGTMRWVDIGCGAAACFVLLFRSRARTGIAIALAVVAAFAATGGVANMVALYGVARYRRLPVALAVGAADVLAGYCFWLVYPENNKLSLTLVVNVAIVAAIVAWGAMRQTQESLLLSYRERAERAEREQRLRETQIRQAERTRIAREMHDVVTHRISLVALHAGGLMVDPEPKIDVVRGSAELIYGSARQALEELRLALGALRADEPTSLEQPGLDRIQDLVEDALRAGQEVELDMDPAIVETAPPGIGRDAYRFVQEGLANVRKHAPNAVAVVTVAAADGVLRVRVVNEMVDGSLGVPGAGAGLIGLRERADLAGGTLSHGPVDGRFELVGELPWT
ncbi:sensor histidine kinase [Stackebrandtia nassauensis]|uniref:histidine kinase n=1 Tax=Stackebrandtia nassauensis (strain DSM 44728 / CIP 108903 / NRRL B-16338 / NBRC 102104 / LLR-40K-21) TaxID=446470 RepID=D3Q1P9_STANL|nr:histidine kinase [Stackebrandtia nassauensis]ADD39897.1 histidine kinase dimerization and phosphoacceptor region [Stackebrandtia nassauensis DSM 44728]